MKHCPKQLGRKGYLHQPIVFEDLTVESTAVRRFWMCEDLEEFRQEWMEELSETHPLHSSRRDSAVGEQPAAYQGQWNVTQPIPAIEETITASRQVELCDGLV